MVLTFATALGVITSMGVGYLGHREPCRMGDGCVNEVFGGLPRGVWRVPGDFAELLGVSGAIVG